MSEKKEEYRGEEHIFLEPSRAYSAKPSHKGGYVPSDVHADEESAPIEKQFDATVSAVESKKSIDNSAYYVLDLKISAKHPALLAVVKKFNARILSELSESEVLVTSSIDDLKSAKTALESKTFRNNLFRIHQLRLDEILDPELKFKESEEKTLTIYLVPNLGFDKAKLYMDQISKFLSECNISIKGIFINDETGDAFLDASVTEDQLHALVNSFGFFFRVHEIIKVQSIIPTNNMENPRKTEIDFNAKKITGLPKICLLDTGVNEVPQLTSLISSRYVESPNTMLDDIDNHGTSVASLAAYGDTLSEVSVPKARIISHKILQGQNCANIVSALGNAIRMYPDCHTFNCSVNYAASELGLKLATRMIDSMSQTTNSLVVFSAGNIAPSEVEMAILSGARYPDYINEAPVFHPSDAPSVFSVGAYSRHCQQGGIAPADAPAPFTRFGTNLKELKACPKPELVEHGGNLCISSSPYSCSNMGIITLTNSGNLSERSGTSFSAPLVSLHLARLWDKFRNQVHNSETLKAILISTCRLTQNHPRYVGLGVPNECELFCSRFGIVRVVFEGNLPLEGTAAGSPVIPTDEVRIFVPADVSTIELFLVHSDNYSLTAFPKLNTYLTVEVEKPGKKGSVNPSSGLPSAQTHVKHLIYRYKRNVKGDWYFKLIPHAIGISTAQRKNVRIRYGGVVKLTTKEPRFGLGRSVVYGLRRGGNVKMT